MAVIKKNIYGIILFPLLLFSLPHPLKKTYDIVYYYLDFQCSELRSFQWTGHVEMDIYFHKSTDTLILDAQSTVHIRSVELPGKASVSYIHREPFLKIFSSFRAGSRTRVFVDFYSSPPFSRNLPWEGGYTFQILPDSFYWAGIACQEKGASLWWPCKDDWDDKADSGVVIRISGIPSPYLAVSNGQLIHQNMLNPSAREFQWRVKNPIHPYNISITLAPFIQQSDTFHSSIHKKTLPLHYFVLPGDSSQAGKHFSMVKPMLRCLENALGPYPFYEDGYKLIQTPYLGMEHQSGIAYGNQYKTGYKGDLKMTNGLPFDFIILHESIHEWFGNALTASDISEMWIHEAMTTWAESLYAACIYGDTVQEPYIQAMRYRILNDAPMQGNFRKGTSGSSDMYAKGAFMIQGLLPLSDNPELFFSFPQKILQHFSQKPVTTSAFIRFAENHFRIPLKAYFNTYLNQSSPPVLIVKSLTSGKKIIYWENVRKGFYFPVFISPDKKIMLHAGQKKEIHLSDTSLFKKIQKGYFRIQTMN